MSKEPDTPPRGDAAWKIAKKAVADRNEAAYARGRADRAAKRAEAVERRRAADRDDLARLPKPPAN